jgi:putative ABC transport system permease protein
MFQNYLTIALRNLRKNRTYTTLNVLGLGLSVASCLLIFMLLRHHLSFDTYHGKGDRVARVVTEVHVETTFPIPGAPNPMANALQSEVSIVEKAAMTASLDEVLISLPKAGTTPEKYKERGKMAFVQPKIFEILDYHLLRGDLNAMQEPNTALLTEQMASKYFKTEDPIGKTFRFDNKVDVRIVGILRNLPKTTDYPQEILVSWNTRNAMPDYAPNLESWAGINSSTYCFALLREGHGIGELETALLDFTKKHPHPESVDLFKYLAKPLLEMHFDTDYGAGMAKKHLWALALIGLFLLITACVNFINMATAQALGRMREVGVRKSLGSTRGQLFWQFMFETGMIVTAALFIGGVLSTIALPYLNNWTKTDLLFDVASLKLLLPFTVILGLLLTLLAGFYPGLLQARFRTVESLKGSMNTQQIGGFSLRRVLVTSQFAISQMLIIGAAVVIAQMRFAQNADWGFRPGAIITMEVPEATNMKTLKQQLSTIAGVKSVTLCFQPPAANSNNQTGVTYDNRPEGEKWMLNTKPADADYMQTFGLKMVAGRNLQASDTIREYVVNETFVKKLNLASPEEVLNKKACINGKCAPIVGVVRDFHNWGLSMPIAAIAFGSDVEQFSTCAVELQSGNPNAVLPKIKEIWEQNYPNYCFESKFMEAELEEFLETETMIMRLVTAFAGIAIFVGCLGLYGLSAFMVARKRKEIGIRKSLGETVGGVLWLFGKEYLRLVLIAFLVAAPLAWWTMNGWLEAYQYRISIGVSIFVLSLFTTFWVAVITVGFQSVKAALANPVKSLRSE